ncbi:YceI family protein [Paenibacillus sinopodophylli]|uniref:YceI family protein n=1 Tax=Paenibacillus sinopodophylli TaxID=1837342 RepID=UPI001486CC35|nr:YceI family protein [Paenibacillus sinopodophylli]
MKNKKIAILAAAIIIVVGGALYYIYDHSTGNHVEIESVINEAPAANNSGVVEGTTGNNAQSDTELTEASGEAANVDGMWTIGADSKVYFSVTTSRETVNYELSKVTGTWDLNSADAAQTSAVATVDVTSMDSGNSQRDSHIAGSEYLDTTQFPNAEFKAVTFEGLPAEWTSGEVYDVKIKGELTVKGISKEVEFAGKTSYDGSSLKLEANTVVTFDDFGMKSPHTIVMETENNLTIELRLALSK